MSLSWRYYWMSDLLRRCCFPAANSKVPNQKGTRPHPGAPALFKGQLCSITTGRFHHIWGAWFKPQRNATRLQHCAIVTVPPGLIQRQTSLSAYPNVSLKAHSFMLCSLIRGNGCHFLIQALQRRWWNSHLNSNAGERQRPTAVPSSQTSTLKIYSAADKQDAAALGVLEELERDECFLCCCEGEPGDSSL